MRFRKAVLAVSLLVACFMLAPRSAKADDIFFTDLGDTILVTGNGRFSSLALSCPEAVICTVLIAPPSPGDLFSTTNFPHNLANTLFSLGIRENGSNTLSDALVIANLFSSAAVNFLSDPPGTGGDLPGVPCGTVIDGIPVPCDITETGVQQLAGTITWVSGKQDRIFFTSDVTNETPEPASLVLFGSGLALAGGFLRRRWRLGTPAA